MKKAAFFVFWLVLDSQGNILYEERLRCKRFFLEVRVGWSNKIIFVVAFCFFQVAVSALGMFSCVCEDGPVTGRMAVASPEADGNTCASEGDVGICFCCAGEDTPHTCTGTLVPPFLLSSRSASQQTPASQSGGVVSAACVNWHDAPSSTANPSGYIRIFLHIESAIRRSTASTVLLI